MQERGILRIYGCGGAGVNTAYYYNDAGDTPACASIETAYLDTSRSNLKNDMSEDSIYILPNVDGSGKVRAENHKEIAGVTKQVLQQLPPGDLNVVVFSASGGSGSVFGPLVVSELLSRGLPTIAIVVGSDESIITCKNTLNTLKSLQAISEKTKLPLVMFYEHNDHSRKRSEVDSQMYLVISSLAVLASRRNRAFDMADLTNFIQFNKVTTVSPQLALLEVFDSNQPVDEIKDAISIASIYTHEDDDHIKAVPEYGAAGYLVEKPENIERLHFVISIDTVPSIAKKINSTLDDYYAVRDSRVKQDSILSKDDETTDSGLVL